MAERRYVGSSVRYVIGVDEAGRGCMAGPVGVAAALYRLSSTSLSYRVDDSKLMKESDREATLGAICAELGTTKDLLLQTLLADRKVCTVQYQATRSLQALAAVLVDVEVVNAKNILNATLEGMAAVCNAIVAACQDNSRLRLTPDNCAVLLDGNRVPWTFLSEEERSCIAAKAHKKALFEARMGAIYPLLDGYSCQTVVKGDRLLLSIASASVVAKVARDNFVVRVMHVEYPQYAFALHKGYCTPHHKQLLKQLGPCSYHRLGYAPVKAWAD